MLVSLDKHLAAAARRCKIEVPDSETIGIVMQKESIAPKAPHFLVAYYTGTGSTALVAECFCRELEGRGLCGTLQNISCTQAPILSHDLLVVVFPVHASNAPQAMYKWLDALPPVSKTPAVVVSVSGGGEIVPNTASRVSSIKRLAKKGYEVVHDEMIVMPSNFIIGTHELLAAKLLEVLPSKVERIATSVLSGAGHRPKPLLVDRFLSFVGELEKPATRWFGKAIVVSDACIGCGWCAEHCPAGNITVAEGKPTFTNHCHACLSCIYGCPQNALAAKRFKFIIVKEGYDLECFQQKLPLADPVDLDELAKGYIWSGVKKYLQE
ncbi:MAG: EFR1 family ferrodoxin [Eggerthellaceae bacterium]|nr:EFR1 family ferrodoxin [Eggerthellaceae bacterium]